RRPGGVECGPRSRAELLSGCHGWRRRDRRQKGSCEARIQDRGEGRREKGRREKVRREKGEGEKGKANLVVNAVRDPIAPIGATRSLSALGMRQPRLPQNVAVIPPSTRRPITEPPNRW